MSPMTGDYTTSIIVIFSPIINLLHNLPYTFHLINFQAGAHTPLKTQYYQS